MDAELLAEITAGVEKSLKPYRKGFAKHESLPEKGVDREEILELMQTFKNLEAEKWKDGYVSGAVYHGNQEYIDFMNQVYAINSQSNPLHPEI